MENMKKGSIVYKNYVLEPDAPTFYNLFKKRLMTDRMKDGNKLPDKEVKDLLGYSMSISRAIRFIVFDMAQEGLAPDTQLSSFRDDILRIEKEVTSIL